MSLFDADIVTSSLRVGDGYNVCMEFLSSNKYHLNDLFYGDKIWKRDIDHSVVYVCKIFEQVTIDMFSVWIKESELGLCRTLRKYLKKHCMRHNISDKISFSKGANGYSICFVLPEEEHWIWRSNKTITTQPEIRVLFKPK